MSGKVTRGEDRRVTRTKKKFTANKSVNRKLSVINKIRLAANIALPKEGGRRVNNMLTFTERFLSTHFILSRSN
jgi:hypothetical protein